MCCSVDIFLGLIAIIFPPFPVWVKTGLCSADSLINILLCMLGFLPGLLHSWYIIAKFPESDYEMIPHDAESGRVTYIYVQTPGPAGPQRAPVPKNPPPTQGYGTTVPMNAPTVHQEQNGTWTGDAGESAAGPSGPAPPTYAQAVQGDHKIQTT